MNKKFYFIVKSILRIKFTDNQVHSILNICILWNRVNLQTTTIKIIKYIEDRIKTNSPKQKQIFEVIDEVNSDIDCKLFIFSLKFYTVKDLLLAEAKTKVWSQIKYLC